MPKGVLWRQEDIFHAALNPGNATDLAALVARAREGGPRALPAPPFMHGAAHWAAFSIWHVGGTIVVQSDPRRLDPADVWSTVERERIGALTIVGDAFGRPLLDELRRRRRDVSSLRRLTTGGAILSATLKREFLELLPGVRILDALGSSESGAQASKVTQSADEATTGDFEPGPDNTVLREDLCGEVAPGSGERGWLARRGHVPLGYYRDPEKSARTFPVVNGVRYAVPGDRATLEADGRIRLLGRDSVTINTGGEKVFAEEVEHALKHHPAVYDAVVVGTPHERWGQQVTALVRLRDGRAASEAELRGAAGEHVADFKVPRRVLFVDEIVRSPSGKPDYRWAREAALALLA
jgi:fatty-acyl-CoA synthase